jgi:hypothetical protein
VLYTTNTSHHKQETFLYEYLLHQVLLPTEPHNRMLIFDNKLLKDGHHFDYWNQLLNVRMRISYLCCHAAGLRCYLVIHIQYKPITYITVVLLPFVTCLLTVPHNNYE